MKTPATSSEMQDAMTNAVYYPEAHTVKGQVLAHFLQGRLLTHKDCWLECFSSRLSHHVWDLKRDGWPIEKEMRSVKTGDGRNEEIAYYSLPAEAIREAEERGQCIIDIAWTEARRG